MAKYFRIVHMFAIKVYKLHIDIQNKLHLSLNVLVCAQVNKQTQLNHCLKTI